MSPMPAEKRNEMSLIAEIRQRKLVQWTVAYFAAAFALLQGIDVVALERAYRQPDGQRPFIKADPGIKNSSPTRAIRRCCKS